MAAATAEIVTGIHLQDAALFREQCYVGGDWIDADSGRSFDVTDPATGQPIGVVPAFGAAETRRAIEAANAAYPAWRALTAKERANILRRWYELMLEHQEDLAIIMTAEQGKPLAESRGRDPLRRIVHRVVRRRRQTRLRRRNPGHPRRPPHRGDQGAGWRGGLHHAVELPQRHDYAKGGPGIGGRMHGRGPSCFRHALLGIGARRTRHPCRYPARRLQRDHRPVPGDGRRTDRQSHCPQAVVHRIHRGRQAAPRTMRGHGEEGLHGVGRQCPVHRLRRRGRGRRCRGRHRLQVPQRGPDLRLREPLPGARRHLRGVRDQARGRQRGIARRPRFHGRRGTGTADRHGGGGEGRRPHPRCRRSRCQRGRGRQAPHPGWHVLRADRVDRRHPHDEGRPGRDLRAVGAAVQVRRRGRRHPARQRHRVRTWPPTSTVATSAGSGGSAKHWSTASSASTSASSPRRSPRSAA